MMDCQRVGQYAYVVGVDNYKQEEINMPDKEVDNKEVHPQTVGELRKFLEPFDDDCPLKGLNYGAFRYVLDGAGKGQVQYV